MESTLIVKLVIAILGSIIYLGGLNYFIEKEIKKGEK